MLSLVLGFGPVGVILVAGGFALLDWPGAVFVGQTWAAVILIFLAGVVRGLSFLTDGGPRASQVIVMGLRFWCGLAALLLPPILAMPVLAAGYLSALLYDPFAARTGAAPRYFAKLRPPQMVVALIGLFLLLIAALR